MKNIEAISFLHPTIENLKSKIENCGALALVVAFACAGLWPRRSSRRKSLG